MLDRNKDAQATILNDLQTEVKSLKSLLISRRPVSSASNLLDQASNVTSPTAETNGISPRLSAAFNTSARPTIPSWQMAAKNAATEAKASGGSSSSSEKQPATVEEATTEPAVADAEAKEQ
jgi:peroxin-14